MSQTDAIKAIRQAARKRDRADEQRRQATADLRDAVLRAQGERVPMGQIAQEAGLSRQGLWELVQPRKPS